MPGVTDTLFQDHPAVAPAVGDHGNGAAQTGSESAAGRASSALGPLTGNGRHLPFPRVRVVAGDLFPHAGVSAGEDVDRLRRRGGPRGRVGDPRFRAGGRVPVGDQPVHQDARVDERRAPRRPRPIDEVRRACLVDKDVQRVVVGVQQRRAGQLFERRWCSGCRRSCADRRACASPIPRSAGCRRRPPGGPAGPGRPAGPAARRCPANAAARPGRCRSAAGSTACGSRPRSDRKSVV